MTERHMHHSETLPNGCRIDVKAEILRDGSLQMSIEVYRPDGVLVFKDNKPAVNGLDMEAAFEWGIARAKTLGNDQKAQ